MRNCIAIIFFLFFSQHLSVFAQDTTLTYAVPVALKSPVKQPPVNFIKLNLAALPMNNFSVQYERAVSKKISLALGLRMMPQGGLPFASTLGEVLANNDSDFVSAIQSIRIKNLAITPELRWYPGRKGYGRGFYIATYYRYLTMDISSTKNIEISFDDNSKRNIRMNAGLKMHNIGLMLGAQWMLSKRIFIDWWIIGAQAGLQSGAFTARPDMDFSTTQIAEMTDDIKVNFTALGQTTKIDAKEVNVKTNSLLALTGLRGGLCLGVRF